MAEAQPPQGGQVGKPEGKPPQGLEILDAEKLGKYGALYGRFLLASQAQPEEVANILDPNQPTEFNLTTTTLKERNYNPISANLSFQERQEQWKDVPSFTAAYSQWRTKFTELMTKITTDSKREMVLRMIMHDLKKAAADFKESDADKLFKEFCSGKSDVTAFIDRVTKSLANPNGNGKIDPMTIRNVLPHIEWIASGLFGKKTASTVVTRLIELESALHNNPEQVIGIFNSDKQRVKNLTDEERGILGSLHSLIPQASQTVTSEPVAKPTPAVVSEEPKLDKEEPPTASVQPPEADLATELAKWKERLAAARTIPNIVIARAKVQELEEQIAAAAQTQPPAPPIAPIQETTPVIPETKTDGDELLPAPPIASSPKPGGFDKEAVDGLLKQIIESEGGEGSPPAPPPATSVSEPEPETPHQPIIEEVPVGEGSELRFKIKVDGKDLGFEFYKAGDNGIYSTSLLIEGQGEYMDIPDGIIVFLKISGTSEETITIMGGKGTKLNIKDLYSLGFVTRFISILTPEYENWKKIIAATAGHEGQATLDTIFKDESVGPWISIEQLGNYLKTRKEETEKNEIAGKNVVTSTGPQPIETTAGENIINAVNIKDSEFSLPEKFLKDQLQGSDQDHLIFSFSYVQLRNCMEDALRKSVFLKHIFMPSPYRRVDDLKDKITLKGVEAEQPYVRETRMQKLIIGAATFDLIIANSTDGITANIQNYHPNLPARIFGGNIKDRFKDIDRLIKKELNKRITTDNPAWLVTNISIKDGKFLIRFENLLGFLKTPQEV